MLVGVKDFGHELLATLVEFMRAVLTRLRRYVGANGQQQAIEIASNDMFT